MIPQNWSDAADCSGGVCKPKSTAMFDNADCSIEFVQVLENEAQAQETLAWLIEKAKGVENEPHELESQIQAGENGVELKAKFTFGCQAETVLFQMALR